MTKLLKIFSITNFKLISKKLKFINLKNVFYLASNFITLYKVKILILVFTVGYLFFFTISFYLLYKSYLLTLSSLNEFLYQNLSNDISKLNQFHPIQSYYNSIYSKQYIGMIYNKLGIIDYNDYIYAISNDSKNLTHLFNYNQTTHDKVSSIVFADIIQQHSQLIGDLGEQLMKRLLRLSLPLLASITLFTGFYLAETLNIVMA